MKQNDSPSRKDEKEQKKDIPTMKIDNDEKETFLMLLLKPYMNNSDYGTDTKVLCL